MRFLRPSRVPAEPDHAAAKMPIDADSAAVDSSSMAATAPDNTPADEPRLERRPSEGVRILLEKIDSLTSRLSACEKTIETMSMQLSQLAEKQAADNKVLEDHLRRQIERQVADLSVAMDRRQKESGAKQAKLLELLAAEINKVRLIAEAAEPGEVEAQGTKDDRRPPSARSRAHASGPLSDPAASDVGGGLADVLAQGSTPLEAHDPERRDLEFWDWLDSLPVETSAPPATGFIDIELDLDDLAMEPQPPLDERSH